MKLRNIKKNTINAALNNTSYVLNVSIKLKRELTDNDLIDYEIKDNVIVA